MTSNRILALLSALLVLATACSASAEGASGASPRAPAASSHASVVTEATPAQAGTVAVSRGDLADIACSIPHDWLVRTWRGYREDRSPEIQMLPYAPDYVGSGLPHVGPWPYAQDIPMFWYGPGQIASAGEVHRPVTLAGVAPTTAGLLRFPFHPADGTPMREAIAGTGAPPRLIVTMVWDAGGMDVLDRWKDDWPYLRSLIPDGTWFTRATVGSSPTSTAQTHATIGTGSFPDHHGLVGHQLRIAGRIVGPWDQGPAYLIDPTLGDLYDLAKDNRPIVGELGTVSIHLGMMGHGSMWGGGDRDIAAVREKVDAETLGAEGFAWNLPPLLARYYRLPGYLNDVPGFEADVRDMDAADGRLDGRWRTNDIEQLLSGFETPARIPYQTRVLETLIEREGFGADDVPDLLFVNYKIIDYISHVWTVNSREMQDAVRAHDAALKTFVAFLDRQVGRGRWAMVITADHGSIPDPDVTGALSIPPLPLTTGINTTFDTDGDDVPIVEHISPTAIFVNEAELRQNGFELDDVARWLMDLTKGDAVPSLPASEADDPLFQAAFPSSLMSSLPCLPEARA